MTKSQAKKIAQKLIGKTIMWIDCLNGDVNNKRITSYNVIGVGDCGGNTIALQTIKNKKKDYLLWLSHNIIGELDKSEVADIQLPSGTIHRISVQ